MKYRSNCYIYFSNFLFLSLFCSIKFRIRLDIMRKLNEKKKEKKRFRLHIYICFLVSFLFICYVKIRFLLGLEKCSNINRSKNSSITAIFSIYLKF